jgi:hypothetical protein
MYRSVHAVLGIVTTCAGRYQKLEHKKSEERNNKYLQNPKDI